MTDNITERIVIGFLGVIGLSAMIGGIILTLNDRSVPDSLIAMGGVAVGSLGSILARLSSGGPTEVQVMNQPRDAVPVEEAGQTVFATVALTLCVVILTLIFLRIFGVF